MDKTNIAVRVFDTHAQTYQDKYMDVSAYRATLDVLCASIVSGAAEVLELACGPGNVTKYLLDKRPELRILATDLSPNMLARAQANNPHVSIQLLDCREIVSLNRSFDAIVCGFCLPYLSPTEALALIRDAATVLRKDGVLFLSTMEDDPAKSGLVSSSTVPAEQLFIQYHQASFLTDALLRHGFTVLALDRVASSAADGSATTDLIDRGTFGFTEQRRSPMSAKVPADIDAYIAGFPEATQRALQQVRTTIRKAAPDAEEAISYAMPAFKLHGKALVYFAGHAHHIGFYATPAGHEAFKKELGRYKQGKGSVQFPLDGPMPMALIARMVKFKAKTLAERTTGTR